MSGYGFHIYEWVWISHRVHLVNKSLRMKIFRHLTVMILLLGAGILPMHADGPESDAWCNKNVELTGGVGLGISSATFSVHHLPEVTSGMRPGGYLTGVLDLDIHQRFRIQADAGVNCRRSTIKYEGERGRMVRWGVQVGVTAVYRIAMPMHHWINIGFGPYTNFGLSADYRSGDFKKDLYDRERAPADRHPILDPNENGFTLNVGYEFPFGLEVVANSRYGITNVLMRKPGTLIPITLSTGVVWRFHEKGHTPCH